MNRPPKPTPRKRARQTLAFLRDGEPSKTNVETTVLGPYKDRDKRRLIVIEDDRPKSVIAESPDEAARLKAKLSERILKTAERAVGEVPPGYEACLSTRKQHREEPVAVRGPGSSAALVLVGAAADKRRASTGRAGAGR